MAGAWTLQNVGKGNLTHGSAALTDHLPSKLRIIRPGLYSNIQGDNCMRRVDYQDLSVATGHACGELRRCTTR